MDYAGFLIESKIADSYIANAGKGRFFLKNYEKGTTVRIQDLETDLNIYKNIQEIQNADQEHILNFAHSRCKDSDINTQYMYVNKVPFYTNHSLNNNISFQIRAGKKLTYITRDVKAGEEMLQNYEDYTINPWFEEYLHSIGEKSLREFGVEQNKFTTNNEEVLEQLIT